jgi:hypothetical protein
VSFVRNPAIGTCCPRGTSKVVSQESDKLALSLLVGPGASFEITDYQATLRAESMGIRCGGRAILFTVCLIPLFFTAATTAQAPAQSRDGQHDFDFEIGKWKTQLKRLTHPLTGSSTWVEYEGTSTVTPVWGGRANLVELEANGPAGHIEALSLRLYNSESHQWSLNFANSSGGSLSQPTIGEFKNGVGEFYDQETLNGRAIFVRFVIKQINPNLCEFEQAFSADGGKKWEINWIATDNRTK